LPRQTFAILNTGTNCDSTATQLVMTPHARDSSRPMDLPFQGNMPRNNSFEKTNPDLLKTNGRFCKKCPNPRNVSHTSRPPLPRPNLKAVGRRASPAAAVSSRTERNNAERPLG
jgi:hypothetical protein